MDEATKITLSADEQQLVCNREWILLKRGIMEKAVSLLGQVAEQVSQAADGIPGIPGTIFPFPSPRIYKGENYLGLPYALLDYPGVFSRQDMFAIRMLFWWGESFSIHVLGAGSYLPLLHRSLEGRYRQLAAAGYFISVHESPWQHHFGKDNYVPVADMTEADYREVLGRGIFIKIAKKIPVSEWDRAGAFFKDAHQECWQYLT